MAVFQRKPFNAKPPSKLNKMIHKNPLFFGIPFCLLMVGASFALTPFTQTRYDLQDQKHKAVTKEQEMGLDRKNRKKFDIREEYYRLSAESDGEWEPKRIQRPKGLPEWGVPPTEPPSPPSEADKSKS